MTIPSTLQVYASVMTSPSASLVEPVTHESVSVSVGELGLTLTDASAGAVFATVTVLLVTALPFAVPSFGVTTQATVSPSSKKVLESVLVVAAMLAPFTRQP
jgi:hypothetical protein